MRETVVGPEAAPIGHAGVLSSSPEESLTMLASPLPLQSPAATPLAP